MAKKGDIYLGLTGSEEKISAFGRKLLISDNKLSRQERTANGRLVEDIITTKKKITLAYETIDGDALANFLALYELESELSILIFNEDDVTTTGEGATYDQYDVLMEPIDRERLLLLGEGLWSGVNIVLNEI